MNDPEHTSSLHFLGHSTVVLDLDGVRLITDPVLRDQVIHLRRYSPAVVPEQVAPVDAVLVSHLHLDHLDVPSLELLGEDVRLIVPAGAARLLQRRGFHCIEEVKVGQSIDVGAVRVTATYARHSGFRPPAGPTGPALGFLIQGSESIYFAGDTNLFPGMADIAQPLDLALIPVWGWGRHLGPGHLDPRRAAEALRLLRPAQAVPIHWGTLASAMHLRRDLQFLTEPPLAFARYAASLAPDVRVRILQPGESMPLQPVSQGR